MNKNWHAKKLEEIFIELESHKDGLSELEAKKRLKKFGKNILPKQKPYPMIRLFLSQFNSPLMFILFLTVVISFLLKHYSDAIFISVVLFINTTVGFYQENKASNALSDLKKMVTVRARVLRDSNEKEIDSENLIVGDVIILKSGDKIPADGRIIESKDLKINEASLTGEWRAVKKLNRKELEKNTQISDQGNMVFMGTIVESGEARVLITAVGVDTEIGKIVSLLKATKERKTPLQKQITSISYFTGAFILLFIFVVITIGYLTQKSFADVFVASLALAVSAIPEGLLPAITVILVLGMRRILKQKGLVRKLSATETLGSVTVICTDKTGTLTEGNMAVSHILTSKKELLIKDNIRKIDKNNAFESHITALKIATLTNDAFVENPEAELDSWIIRGTPTEKALLMAGMQAGLNKKDLQKQFPILDKISFDSKLKYASTYHSLDKQKNILYVIGAPEILLALSKNIDDDGSTKKLSTTEIKKLTEKMEDMTQKGLRVIVCACKEYSSKTKYKKLNSLVDGLTVVGFIAIKDPLRKDAKESIALAQKAGIRTVIITGDHKLTAKTIAAEIGINTGEEDILEGKDLENITDIELKELSKKISIYARVLPEHKLRIVSAMQENGEIVAMIGDGVNDAPALKAADIGVSLGSGTDVAKEVSDLILLDGSFKTILKAIEQGRVIFQNIRKVFVYLVADDFSELFLFLATMALGLPLPLLPAQILWINLVEDGFPDIALTTEQEIEGVMEEKPRSPKEPLLNKSLRSWMIAVFFITGAAAFLTFFGLLKFTGDINKTRAIIFTLMCLDSLLFAFSVRSFKKTIFRKDIFSNKYLVVATFFAGLLLVASLYLPPLQKLLATQPLHISEWSLIISISLIEIVLIEFFKKILFTNKKLAL